MDTNQLKMIVDMVNQLGGHATTGFIWYLVFDKLLPVVEALSITGGVLYTFYRIIRQLISGLRCYNFICNIRDENNIGRPGYLTDSEYKTVVRKIHQALEANR